MRVEIKNVGSISNFNVDISGLTVVSGENDSGKTALSKVIYSLGQSSSFYKFKRKILVRNRIKNIYDKMFMLLNKYIHAEFPDENEEDLNGALTALMGFLYTARRMTSADDLDFDPIYVVENTEHILRYFHISDDEVRKELTHMVLILRRIAMDNVRFADHFLSSLKEEFSSDLVKKNSISEFSEITITVGGERSYVKFDNKKIIETSGDFDIPFIDSTFVDGPAVFLLEKVLGRTDYVMRSKVRSSLPHHVIDLCSKIDGTRNTLSSINEDDETCWNMNDFYDGSISFEPEKEDFHLKKDGYFFSGNNVSSGVKALSVMDILSRGGYLNTESLIILDEPETNLHPKWQKKYAEAIVKLSQKGVRILVNTHSPYMLESLKAYSGFFKSSAKFYFSHKVRDEVSLIDTHGDISIIIDALSGPLRDLMLEMQGEPDDF
ncbi:AAA family ATPase [Klebsiella pneumoniae]|uniref:AAA family ATPase n=1 Tax=Klebsiella pneumoniae TaxID=573 RepID=UPI00217582F9|nr:AAA family ATPase [Klebsiella pneumoniae]MDP0672555.1 AAA family ATPase [Klebsiella pneumoniae]UWA37705.1 AAA family ATPase [Klebsiella pneumoniae]HCJ9932052.1 AAA family ATPase [Klebsiella pneumoniae]